MWVNGLYANFAKICNFASQICLGTFKHKEEVRIDRAQLRCKNPLKAKNEIVGRNRIAIGPFGVRSNVKGPNGRVLVMIPAFSHPRVLFGRVLRIGDDETFNQCGKYSSVRDSFYETWIKAFGFATDG